MSVKIGKLFVLEFFSKSFSQFSSLSLPLILSLSLSPLTSRSLSYEVKNMTY